MKTHSSIKQKVEQQYQTLILNLDNTKTDIVKYKAKNTKLANLQTDFNDEFAKQIDNVKQVMKQTIDGMVWDNLVIAFFGETNAGKSTTIEALRILFDKTKKNNGDGLIVGDGRSDFTKTYNEYKLNIFNYPFTLIDVPGIEGKEEDFKDDIKRALQQAHLVFYVQGHNKKPDEATAAKIKKYLNEWVNVYSIYNVRGGAGNYDEPEERETLLTKDINKTNKLIEETFRNILGDVYQGNIAVQSLLAMCAKASFSKSREDLIATQNKLIKYFGTKDKIFTFSNFNEIINLIHQKTSNFEDELILANKQKLVALCKQTIKKLSDFTQTKEKEITTLKTNLKKYDTTLTSSISDIEHGIVTALKTTSNGLFAQLQNDLCNLVETYDDNLENKLKYKIINFRSNYQHQLQNILSVEIRKLNTKLKDYQKGYINCFKRIPEIDIPSITLSPINIDNIMSELEFEFKDFLKSMGGLAGAVGACAALGLIGGPLGAAMGAFTGMAGWGVKQMFSNSSAKDKANAKAQIRSQIKIAREKATTELENQINYLIPKINQKLQSTKSDIKNDMTQIDTVLKCIEQNNNNINQLLN